MATKIYLQYKEPQHRKWQYASCVVDDDIQTNAEADELLAYGGVHNGFIDELVDYSKFGRLEDWNVLLIESSNEGFSNELKFNDKPKCIVDGERKLKEIRKETKRIKKETEATKKRTEAIKIELEYLRKKNIALWQTQFDLTHEESVWANENFELLKSESQYFRLTPNTIRRLYAEAHNTKPVETPEAFEPIKEVEEIGEYIEILDCKVNPQLFKDYITHLDSAKRCKSWQMGEYEDKRVILHQRLFEALGGDRLDRDRGRGRDIYIAIEKVIARVHECLCGGTMDGFNRCSECGTPITLQTVLTNLKEITHGRKE